MLRIPKSLLKKEYISFNFKSIKRKINEFKLVWLTNTLIIEIVISIINQHKSTEAMDPFMVIIRKYGAKKATAKETKCGLYMSWRERERQFIKII